MSIAITMLYDMPIEAVGYLPGFLVEADPRPAREQFNERYTQGGWRPMDGFKRSGVTLRYPGDPPFVPFAMIEFRQEKIFVYPGDFVMILQPDGSFEVSRMD